jgi:predicted MFS family arabinose efflux permease
VAVVVGLAVFGVVFAMNSSIHSSMILAYTDAESVSLNMGFYCMANAAGRLVGTLLSGGMILLGALQACLWTSSLLVAPAFLVSTRLPAPPRQLRPMN